MIGGDSSGGDPCSPQSPHHPHHHPSPHGASSQLYQPHHPGYVTGKASAGEVFSGVGGGVTTPLHPHHQPSSQPQAALAPLANNNHMPISTTSSINNSRMSLPKMRMGRIANMAEQPERS